MISSPNRCHFSNCGTSRLRLLLVLPSSCFLWPSASTSRPAWCRPTTSGPSSLTLKPSQSDFPAIRGKLWKRWANKLDRFRCGFTPLHLQIKSFAILSLRVLILHGVKKISNLRFKSLICRLCPQSIRFQTRKIYKFWKWHFKCTIIINKTCTIVY